MANTNTVVPSNCFRRRTLSYRTDIVPYDIVLFTLHIYIFYRTHRTHRTHLK